MSDRMYKIILSNQAIKHIKDLPKDVKKRVREVLDILSEHHPQYP